jgi:hypothetical protein
VGLLAAYQELGLRMGLQRVGGDHRPGQVEPVQQRLERADLLGGASDLALGQTGASPSNRVIRRESPAGSFPYIPLRGCPPSQGGR